MYQCDLERSGLAESLFVLCLLVKSSQGKKGSFEVYQPPTFASTSRADLARFCAKLDFPPPVTKRSYNIHMGKIVEKAIIHAEQKMKEAGACLHALVEKHDPESMHVNEDGMSIADVAASGDGTWQKQGHTSRL